MVIVDCVSPALQDWWQARRMDKGGSEVASGLIPSRNRWEKKMRSRDKGVQWNDNGMGTGKRTGSLKKVPLFKVSVKVWFIQAGVGMGVKHTFSS